MAVKQSDGFGYLGQFPTNNYPDPTSHPMQLIWDTTTSSYVVSSGAGWVPFGFGANTPQTYGGTGNGTSNDRKALFDANAAGLPLYLPYGTYRISSNLTLTVPLTFASGAKLSVDTGVTVTINGTVDAGNGQIFSGVGSVVGTFGQAPINVMWFGAVPDFVPTAGVGTSTANDTYINAALAARTYVPYPVQAYGTMSGGTITLNGGYTGIIENGSTVTGSPSTVPGGTTVNNISGAPTSIGTTATGTTISTQNLFTFTPTSGATFGRRSVYAPSGIYRLNAPVSIPDGIDLRGDGKFQTIFACISGVNFGNGMFAFNGVSSQYFTAIRDLSVYCPLGGSTQTGVYINPSHTSAYLENVVVMGFNGAGGTGVNYAGATNMIMRNVVIEACETGLNHAGSGAQIHALLMLGNGTAIKSPNASAQNLWSVFVDIWMANNTTAALDLTNAKYLKFENVAISESSSSSLATAGIKLWGTAHDITIANPDIVFDNGGANGGYLNAGSGIWISGTANNIRIRGGSCRRMQNGLYMDGSGSNLIIDGYQATDNVLTGINTSGAFSGNVKIANIMAFDNGKRATGFSASVATTTTFNVTTGANVASFTGVITNGVLTASAITGTIVAGAWLYYSGSAAKLQIVSGSGTSWNLSSSVTAGSQAMGAINSGGEILSGDTVYSTAATPWTAGSTINTPTATHLSWTIAGNAVATVSSAPATAITIGNGVVINCAGLSTVTITGTAGQFACAAAPTTLIVGQHLFIAGTYGGTGSITGYANPTAYLISATNGSTTFTLQTLAGAPIVTTAGTPTGLTYGVNAVVNLINVQAGTTTGTPMQFAGTYAASFTGIGIAAANQGGIAMGNTSANAYGTLASTSVNVG